MADLQIKTLEGLLARQNDRISEMQKQLEEAKRQVQEIAVRAIEGASGAKTLAHVNEIAMEQAKHRGPQS
jgi:C4-type Zn-finger protein